MHKLAFSIALLLCFNVCLANGEAAPPEVVSAAQKGLPAFLGRIPPEARDNFGFAPSEAIDQAYLGDPVNLHTITPDALLNYGAGTPVASLLSRTDMWYFPVMMQGGVRAFLVVDKMDGGFQAASLGYVNLAKAWEQVRQRWPDSKGFHPRLIAVFQAKEYLVLVPEADSNALIPLFPAGRQLLLDSAANVIERLKPIVRENLKQRPTP